MGAGDPVERWLEADGRVALDFGGPLIFDWGMKPAVLLTLVFVWISNSFAAITVETIAGIGKAGFSGDGGPAVKAELNNPYGLVVGPGRALFVCDMGNDRVRKIDTNGIITTVARSGA